MRQQARDDGGSRRTKSWKCSFFLLLALLLLSCSGSRLDVEVIVPPTLREARNLRYPMSAQLKGQEGTVRIKVFVAADGTVTRSKLLHSSGFRLLDDAAVEYMARLLFDPAQRNGKPEPSLIAWNVRFEITDSSRDAMMFVQRVTDLYHRADADPTLAHAVATQVLTAHEKFASSSTDAISINDYIRLVVLPATSTEYSPLWSECPVRFALFDDFQRRYGDIESDRARDLLARFAAEDLRYSEELCYSGAVADSSASVFSMRVRAILRSNYPELELSLR